MGENFKNFIYSNIYLCTLYSTILNENLKTCLKEINSHSQHLTFLNGKQHYMLLKRCYAENEVINMLAFLINNIFMESKGHILQQIINISFEQMEPLALLIICFTPLRRSLYKNFSKTKDLQKLKLLISHL